MTPQGFEYTNAKNNIYVLCGKEVTLKGGRKQFIYYFTKKGNEIPEFTILDMPEGFEVVENVKTGLPILKRSK